MKTESIIILLISILTFGCSDSVKVSVLSPDGINNLTIISKDKKGNRGWPSFYLERSGSTILRPSYFQLGAGTNLIENEFDVLKIEYESISDKWINNFGEKKDRITIIR